MTSSQNSLLLNTESVVLNERQRKFNILSNTNVKWVCSEWKELSLFNTPLELKASWDYSSHHSTTLTTSITSFMIIDINSCMRGGIRLGKGKMKQGGGRGGKRV